jgi:phosphohistidine phosphatase
MNLLLWRHAEAEDGGMDEASDLARELSTKGQRQARHMAAWLHQHLPDYSRILVSPARRTRQTADALGLHYNIEPRLAPGATVTTILKAAELPSSKPYESERSLLLVGHQPWIGGTARLLLSGQKHDWSVRKAAVWWLVHRERDGVGEWTLRCIMDADLLGK